MATRDTYLYLPGGTPFDLRVPLIPLTVAVFAVFCVIDLSFISPTINNDSNTLLDELWLITQGSENAYGSYYWSALIFQSIPGSLVLPLVILIGSLHILILFRGSRHWLTLLLCMILILPALLNFSRPSKEILLSPVTFLLLGLLCLRLNGLARVLAVALCYLSYAYFMREYYLVIFVTFAGLMILAHLPRRLALVALAVALGALAFAPAELFQLVQGPRDYTNALRLANDTVGVRSAFVNPLPPDNLLNFLYNYGYAAVRLNLPIFFDVRPQEWFLLSVTLTTIGLVCFGLRRGGPAVRACALLVLAHMMTLALFEPDLGSYLRHLTSATIYLAPVLTLFDRRLTEPRPEPAAAVTSAS